MEVYDFLVYCLAYIGLLATSFYFINLFMYYRKYRDPGEATDKTISLIVPAYNEEQGIARTIKSLLALDYPKEKVEIIVVDDGSSDKTYRIAQTFASSAHPVVKVFTKQNGGKASAMNLGIGKARGEIVVTMDADSFIRPAALRKMIVYFTRPEVMCVSPSMGVYKPKGLWGRIVQIEYYMGVFLRKSFATMNAIHVTPGAFSAYRKQFFTKYGGFQVGNITEDLEMALRIQSNHYVIQNAPRAVAYTSSPESFKALLYQRRRWYIGLMKNLWVYRRLFGLGHGPLGYLVLPTAVTTVLLSVILTVYMLIRVLLQLKDELVSLSTVNFQFANYFAFNTFLFQRFFYSLLSRPVFLIAVLFIALLGFYILFSKKQMLYKESVRVNFVLFVFLYLFLFAFWWIISFVYLLFNRRVAWRQGL